MSLHPRASKRDLVLVGVAASVCVIVPLFAKSALDHRVHVELAGAASDLIGVPVKLGDTRVGLTGTLEISDVRVGDSLRAKRVIAAVAPTRVGGGGLSANEILIESPSAHILIEADGRTNLDHLLQRRKTRIAGPSDSTNASNSSLERLRIVDGSVDVEWRGKGTISTIGIAMQLQEDRVHAVAGRSELRLQRGEYQLTGVMPRAALDYERHGAGLQRFLADGGAARLLAPDGRAILQELVIASTEDGDAWSVSARSGIDRPTGNLALSFHPGLGGGQLGVKAENTPLFLLAPWLPPEVNTKESKASGSFSLTFGTKLEVEARVHVEDISLAQSILAKRPLDFDLDIDASAAVHRDENMYYADLDLRSVASGELRLSGKATGQWRRGSELPELAQIELDLQKVSCDAALSALPAGLRPSLAGLELRGNFESHLRLFLSRQSREDTSLKVSSGLDACQVVREPPAADTHSLLADYQHRSPDGRPHLLVQGEPGFSAYDELPEYVPRAFVAAEDARFFVHDGFDVHQIERSLAIDVQTGRFLRGGSTISQQLVKNLFLSRKRTLARKLQEAILTWRMESQVSKKRILEIYLNIIELGDEHTYGITEAAQRWFAISPKDLSIAQTAFLAALTPEPTSMSARIRHAGKLDEVSAARVATILRVMRRSKVISTREYRKAIQTKLTFASSALRVASE